MIFKKTASSGFYEQVVFIDALFANIFFRTSKCCEASINLLADFAERSLFATHKAEIGK